MKKIFKITLISDYNLPNKDEFFNLLIQNNFDDLTKIHIEEV